MFKKHRSKKKAAVTAVSFGEGFIPIPFSDAALLVPTQVAMIASITTIFGIEVSKGLLTSEDLYAESGKNEIEKIFKDELKKKKDK